MDGHYNSGSQDPPVFRDSGAGMNRRSFLKQTVNMGAAAISLGLLNCGGNPATVSRTERRTDRLIMGTAVDLYTIDPAEGFDYAISNTLNGLYDALFRHEGNPPRAVAWLAQQATLKSDGVTWRLTLDKRAVFHDRSPVTAHAVRYTIKRLQRVGKGPAGLFGRIIEPNGIRLLDDHALEVRLVRPIRFFLHLLPWVFVVNPAIVEAVKGSDDGRSWLRSHAAGSGPFTIHTWKPGERYVFNAAPDYWKGWPSAARLRQYERLVIKKTEDRIAALESGQVDLVDWMPPQAFGRFESRPGYRVVQEPGMKTYEIKLNNAVGHTADTHVRRAICHAFDYQGFLAIWKGRAILLNGPLPPGLTSSRTARMNGYRLDMAKARAALARSPWPSGGFDLDFVYVSGLEEERLTGELLKKQLSALAIHVNIIPMAWADAVSIFKDPETAPPMFPLYTAVAYPDPDNYMWSGYHSSHAGELSNPGHYSDDRTDALLDRARFSTVQEEREALYQAIGQTLVDEAVNIFGAAVTDTNIYASHIKGMRYCPVMDSGVSFYDAWIDS